jgi:hypothetical protein
MLMEPAKSFLKSGLECISLCDAEVFGELTGDLIGESRTENLISRNTFPKAISS